jgi:hypothetical protein
VGRGKRLGVNKYPIYILRERGELVMKEIHEKMSEAISKAEEKLNQATYLSESGSNPGLRQMNSNKADWLKWVVYLAKIGFETEKLLSEDTEDIEVTEEDEDGYPICEHCPVTAETAKIIEQKDKTIKELCNKLTEITERLKSLQVSYDCELEYRKALATRAKIDHFTEVLKLAHERCWLDGTVLVTPVEYLDRALLELIKE